ncbi:MAG: N-acetyl-alpha-D-glucosaminyl L-malate synthase BshA [Acidobacteriota bacterium]
MTKSVTQRAPSLVPNKPKLAREKPLSIGITCYPSVGGSGILASQLGSEIARLGHKVHFISYEPPFRLDTKHPNIFFHKVELNEYRLFKYPDYTLPLAVKMVEVANKYKLDVLHVHYAVPHATAALLATQIAKDRALHTPCVITTLHGTDITLLARDPNLGPIIKYSIESSSGVTAVSHSLKEETVQVLKTRKPIETIYNFYRVRTPKKTRAEVRKKLGLKADDFVLIHLSNLRPVKRAEDILRVIGEVKDDPRIKLLVLAGGPFDPFRPMLTEFGIEDRVVVKSNVVDIENYIAASDAGIYASERESFGMGVLETMSFGKPVVATRVGGVSEIVVEGETGFLKRLGDVKAMSKAVRKLAGDPELCARMGTAAKARAEQHFSAEASVAQYIAFYRRIMQECGAPVRHDASRFQGDDLAVKIGATSGK